MSSGWLDGCLRIVSMKISGCYLPGGSSLLRDYMGKLRPKGVTFLGVKGCKRVGISLRLKYKSVGKSVISMSKKVQKI